MFMNIDPSAGAARSAATAGMKRTDCRRLVDARQCAAERAETSNPWEIWAFSTMPQTGGNRRKLRNPHEESGQGFVAILGNLGNLRSREPRKPRKPRKPQRAGRTRSSIGGRYADTRSSRSARRATWLGSMWT